MAGLLLIAHGAERENMFNISKQTNKQNGPKNLGLSNPLDLQRKKINAVYAQKSQVTFCKSYVFVNYSLGQSLNFNGQA